MSPLSIYSQWENYGTTLGIKTGNDLETLVKSWQLFQITAKQHLTARSFSE